MVIDWANACAGSPGADVAVAWLLMAAAEPPAHGVERLVVERFRAVFVTRFLTAVGRDEARRHLREALAARTDDPNLPASEKAAMAALGGTRGELSVGRAPDAQTSLVSSSKLSRRQSTKWSGSGMAAGSVLTPRFTSPT